MITSNKEYNELLYVIDDPNNLTEEDIYYRIPSHETVYEVNLNTREIQIPEFLSVLEDHNSEVLWFKVDRFHDDVDLYGCTCWIQYTNAAKEDFVSVSIPKVIKEYNHDVLYFPWPISGAATKKAGNVTFSFQFFKLDPDNKNKVFYSIHTKPATGKVLHGMHVELDKFLENENMNDANFNPQYSEFLKNYQQLTEAYTKLAGDYNVYWIEV